MLQGRYVPLLQFRGAPRLRPLPALCAPLLAARQQLLAPLVGGRGAGAPLQHCCSTTAHCGILLPPRTLCHRHRARGAAAAPEGAPLGGGHCRGTVLQGGGPGGGCSADCQLRRRRAGRLRLRGAVSGTLPGSAAAVVLLKGALVAAGWRAGQERGPGARAGRRVAASPVPCLTARLLRCCCASPPPWRVGAGGRASTARCLQCCCRLPPWTRRCGPAFPAGWLGKGSLTCLPACSRQGSAAVRWVASPAACKPAAGRAACATRVLLASAPHAPACAPMPRCAQSAGQPAAPVVVVAGADSLEALQDAFEWALHKVARPGGWGGAGGQRANPRVQHMQPPAASDTCSIWHLGVWLQASRALLPLLPSCMPRCAPAALLCRRRHLCDACGAAGE